MNKRLTMHYKSKIPVETVEYIKEILERNNIEVEERCNEESRANTYSLRLCIRDTNVGTNGKGLTKEYARASAYAEFLERLQNKLLSIYPRTKKIENGNIYYSYDEKLLTSEEVIKDGNEFINKLFKDREMLDATLEEKCSTLLKLHKAEYMLTKNEDLFVCVPFYSKNNKKVHYLPYNLYGNMYGSNGMCAGNTPLEALIQGLCEIVERYIQKKIIQEGYSLPDIPMDYIQRYPEIYKRYKKIQEIEGYTFRLKDCSLGGRYPVAALFIIENNTGFYGIKLGCHPDYGIAMERAITEAAQGADITNYSRRSKIDFSNNFVNSEINITNTYKTGRGQYPYSIFSEDASFDFKPVKDVTEMSDEVLLDFMLNSVIGEEYDVLIRDVSHLGFPTFQILIPNISEMGSGSDEGFSLIACTILAEYIINHLDQMDEKDCSILLYVLHCVSRMDLNSSLSILSGTLIKKEFFPGEEFNLGWLYMIVSCYIYQKNYIKAKKKMDLFEEICTARGIKITPFYTALNYYLGAFIELKDHDLSIKYLRSFYDKEICNKIDKTFINPEKVFVNQYLIHDTLNKENCEESKCCDYHEYHDLILLMYEAELKNPIVQEKVGDLLNEMKE